MFRELPVSNPNTIGPVGSENHGGGSARAPADPAAADVHRWRWRQYRKQPPLAHLRSAAALRAQAPRTWGRRWPGPDRHRKGLATPEWCRAYARLAAEVARSR